ncbi:conjugal transfer protein TraB, partial [Vibrio parahaemolyticus]|nr:conjugal transfer protein TraB [Vibrio parahaemolyticus]
MKNAVGLAKDGRCKGLLSAFLVLSLAFLPEIALAASVGVGGGTGGTEFQAFYNF